eukprot:c28143_g1_i2 orf=1539-4217(-)
MASQVWNPQEGGLNEICALLQEYRTPSVDQNRILQRLQRCGQFPDFNNYLTFILCRGEGQSVEVRQVAGLLLKNNLKAQYRSLMTVYQQYIKAELLLCLGAPDKCIRATIGIVISVIIQEGRVRSWPEVLDALLQCLESNDYSHVEGALDALSKICEDIPEELDADVPGIPERPINVFLPRLLKFFSSPHVSLRKMALSSVNQFIIFMPKALILNMDSYLQGLFALANDSAAEVRKLVCSALVQLVEIQASVLQPHMRNIIEYMLQANQDKDDEVALESCEFWTAFCEARLPPELLRDFLPRLTGVLLANMVYADDDDSLLDAEEDDSVPDRDQDLKPRFRQPRMHGAEYEDEDKEEDNGVINSWNLRKCSAAGLDVFSNVFGDEILPLLMPLVQSKLSCAVDGAWKEREAAVLVLGAIAEGCINGLVPHLPQIIAFLVPLLEDKFPLVRSITCWTLSRYSRWIVQAVGEPGGDGQFNNVLTGLLRRILDNNKRVQEAACSAFATLEEEAADELASRLDLILQHLMYAFGKYQRKNLRLLYDAIGTLADAVGGELNQPKYLEMLMPPLITKWQQLADSDRDLFPLLECFASIAQALGPGFVHYAEPVFARCINLIRAQEVAKVDPGRAGVGYDKEFIVCSLDLLSSLVEGLGANIDSLVGQSGLSGLLLKCCSDDAPDIRQSAFALLGDLAKACSLHLQSHLVEFLNVAAKQLEGSEVKDNVSVANNACWAIGEIAVKVGQQISPVVITVITNLVPIISNSEGHNKSLLENSAITLGRLGWVCPELVAPHMEHFMQIWCHALCQIRDDIEKEDAFRGLCAMVRVNPPGAAGCIVPMCQAIGSWHEICSVDLQRDICQVLHGYKQILAGSTWEQCMLALVPALREKLTKKYGI